MSGFSFSDNSQLFTNHKNVSSNGVKEVTEDGECGMKGIVEEEEVVISGHT